MVSVEARPELASHPPSEKVRYITAAAAPAQSMIEHRRERESMRPPRPRSPVAQLEAGAGPNTRSFAASSHEHRTAPHRTAPWADAQACLRLKAVVVPVPPGARRYSARCRSRQIRRSGGSRSSCPQAAITPCMAWGCVSSSGGEKRFA